MFCNFEEGVAPFYTLWHVWRAEHVTAWNVLVLLVW